MNTHKHQQISTSIILVLVLMLVLAPYSFNPRFLTRGGLSFEKQEARAIVCGFGSDIGGGVCRGFITDTNAGTWAVPSDWNSSNNTIETIGGGGGGCGHTAILRSGTS